MLFKINTLKENLLWEVAERDIIAMLGNWVYPKDEPSIIDITVPFAVWEGLNERGSRRRVNLTLRNLGAGEGSGIFYQMYPVLQPVILDGRK
jgi:hypothetical protein